MSTRILSDLRDPRPTAGIARLRPCNPSSNTQVSHHIAIESFDASWENGVGSATTSCIDLQVEERGAFANNPPKPTLR